MSGKCSAVLLITAVGGAAVHLLVVAPENYSQIVIANVAHRVNERRVADPL
jgi:hypothetical protein